MIYNNNNINKQTISSKIATRVLDNPFATNRKVTYTFPSSIIMNPISVEMVAEDAAINKTYLNKVKDGTATSFH